MPTRNTSVRRVGANARWCKKVQCKLAANGAAHRKTQKRLAGGLRPPPGHLHNVPKHWVQTNPRRRSELHSRSHHRSQ